MSDRSPDDCVDVRLHAAPRAEQGLIDRLTARGQLRPRLHKRWIERRRIAARLILIVRSAVCCRGAKLRRAHRLSACTSGVSSALGASLRLRQHVCCADDDLGPMSSVPAARQVRVSCVRTAPAACDSTELNASADLVHASPVEKATRLSGRGRKLPGRPFARRRAARSRQCLAKRSTRLTQHDAAGSDTPIRPNTTVEAKLQNNQGGFSFNTVGYVLSRAAIWV
eukprot:5104508-Pleurochrysis_carterae.AAC.3